MGYNTDFAPLEGWAYDDHQEVHEWVEAIRQVTSAGGLIVATEHAHLLNVYTGYVESRWHHWTDQDRGGVFGLFQRNPRSVATEIMRPIEAVAKNLHAAQDAAAKFPRVFNAQLDPVINKRPGRGGRRNTLGDNFPGQGARTGTW